MKEFRKINIEKDVFDKISELARVLGKKRSQLIKEVFEPLYECAEVLALKKGNLTVQKTVYGIVFDFKVRESAHIEVRAK